jgi:hypothetical protein
MLTLNLVLSHPQVDAGAAVHLAARGRHTLGENVQTRVRSANFSANVWRFSRR